MVLLRKAVSSSRLLCFSVGISNMPRPFRDIHSKTVLVVGDTMAMYQPTTRGTSQHQQVPKT